MGEFTYLDPSQILIDRDNRQRRELTDIEELAASIRQIGLLNPPIIERETHRLIAGERRVTACLSLGLTNIPVQFSDEVDPLILHLIELEENLKRVDLTWQEEVDAIERYHALQCESNPDWSQEKTAQNLGVSTTHISKRLTVASMLGKDIVRDAPKFSTAYNAAIRFSERAASAVKREVAAEIDDVLSFNELPPEAPAPATPLLNLFDKFDIQNDNFLTWVQGYSGPAFNLIHCDFPYGVNVGDKVGQSAAKVTGQYADTKEVYFRLLAALLTHQNKFIAPKAHMIFWYSMTYFEVTKNAIREAGWNVSDFPLIWHKSDNAGIVPDPQRQPRRTYETALFCTRGDQKIVRPVANSFASPTTRFLHTSEKPRPVLQHFFRMVVDENTTVFDPTCGSGNAIVAAEASGAASGLGLELNEEFAFNAKEELGRVLEG